MRRLSLFVLCVCLSLALGCGNDAVNPSLNVSVQPDDSKSSTPTDPSTLTQDPSRPSGPGPNGNEPPRRPSQPGPNGTEPTDPPQPGPGPTDPPQPGPGPTDPPQPMEPPKDCPSALGCLDACQDPNPENCWQHCVVAAGEDTESLVGDLFWCAQQYCGQSSGNPQDRQACVQQHCPEKVTACFGTATSTGTKSCVDALNCYDGCPHQGGESCQNACFQSATGDAQQQLLALYQCSVDNCNGQGGNCVAEKCTSQLQTCLTGGAPGPGGKSCPDLMSCTEACHDPGCWLDCLKGASTEGTQRFTALTTCVQSKCGWSNDPTCAQQKCGDKISACYGND